MTISILKNGDKITIVENGEVKEQTTIQDVVAKVSFYNERAVAFQEKSAYYANVEILWNNG